MEQWDLCISCGASQSFQQHHGTIKVLSWNVSFMDMGCTSQWKDRKTDLLTVCGRKPSWQYWPLGSPYQKQSNAQNKPQSSKFRKGYPLNRKGKEMGGCRTNVKFPSPLKLFSNWCSLQLFLGTGSWIQSHILLRQDHCSLPDFEKPFFKTTTKEKIHYVICPSVQLTREETAAFHISGAVWIFWCHMAQISTSKYYEIIHFGWVSWLFNPPTTTNLCFWLKQGNTITHRLCWWGRAAGVYPLCSSELQIQDT